MSPEKPTVVPRANTTAQVVKRVLPSGQNQNRSSPNVIVTEQKVIRRADDGTISEKIVISPQKP